MRPEAQSIVDQCKEFVRAMQRVEESLGAIGGTLHKEEREAVIREILSWLESEEVTAPYTREVARELIAQLAAPSAYSDYAGSPDYYIQ